MSFVTQNLKRPMLASCLLVIACISFFCVVHSAQENSAQYAGKSDGSSNRRRGLLILADIRQILEQKYYDRAVRGMDSKKRFKEAEEQIKKQDMNWQIYRTIAQVLIELNDSHTNFLPPDRLYRVEYGFTSMLIGNRCFVVDVKKGTDAEKKGLRPGDEIVAFDAFSPNRDNYWVINYLIYGLDPQENLKLKLQNPDGKTKDIVIQSKFLSPKERKEERKKRKADEQSKPYKCQVVSEEVIACKLRTFEVEKGVIDSMMKEVGSRKKLILDLRGNGGGLVSTEMYLTGRFFEKDIVVGTEVVRDSAKQRAAPGSAEKAYKGELSVIIDSESASASEVFARTIQIEKRGKVFGDTSAGAVMTSVGYEITTPLYGNRIETQQPYQVSFVSVSVGDLVMSDGKRLEGIGVTPDIPVGPSPVALFNKTDPVLAVVAEAFGSPITAEKAGTFYFLVPKSEDAVDQDDSPDGKDD
ncbi:MAG TPA: S41 family peptidase [Pyrinomonadaceae bacterium]|nr:S41 family peptidase [Pyrinomonadaceae bacterium]